MNGTELRVSVVVASVGRAEEIGQLLQALGRQTKEAENIVLSVATTEDLPADIPLGVIVVRGPPGLPAQRNRGLDIVQEISDLVVFYDDDFLPAHDSLQRIAEFLYSNPDVCGVTGSVLADGINCGGLSYPEAVAVLTTYESEPRPPLLTEDFLFAYGCNMAFRCVAIGTKRFDEKLPRYAWQEDMDFAGQLSEVGKVIRTNAFAGVHRGVKKARGQGNDLGFSQVINPIYLVRKGTMTPRKALTLISRNLIANHVKVFRPEPYVDRWGRLRGNWVGLWDVLCGKTDPMALPSLKRVGRASLHRAQTGFNTVSRSPVGKAKVFED
jgi:GT2 family glycosyltransferase